MHLSLWLNTTPILTVPCVWSLFCIMIALYLFYFKYYMAGRELADLLSCPMVIMICLLFSLVP